MLWIFNADKKVKILTYTSWTSWDLTFLYFTAEPVSIHSQCGAQCRITESNNLHSLAIQFTSSRQICKFLWKTHGKLSHTSYQLNLEWSSEFRGMEIFVAFWSVTGFWCVIPFAQPTYYVSSAWSMWKNKISHIFSRLDRFYYSGTVDVREIV